MKTTFDLPEELIHQGKLTALQRKTSLKNLVIHALTREINHPSPPPPSSAITRLRKLDTSVWKATPADQYIKSLRADWK